MTATPSAMVNKARTPASSVGGFSLLEASLALSLLSVVFVMMGVLFQSGLGYAARSERMAVAELLVRNRLASLREQAFTYSGFQALASSATEEDGFEVVVRVEPATVYTPGRGFEEAWPEPQRRTLARSLYEVEVEVRWGSGERLTSTTLVGEPARELGTVAVTPATPQTVGRDLTVDFTVSVVGADGLPLQDLQLSWSVEPMDGLGMIESQARDGSRCRFINQVQRVNGSVYHTGGRCRVAVRAVYRGVERYGRSGVLTLL